MLKSHHTLKLRRSKNSSSRISRLQQTSLVTLAVVMVVTIVSPAQAMELFNLQNPAEVKRRNVPALNSPANSPQAKPLTQSLDSFLLGSEQPEKHNQEQIKLKELANKRTAHTKTYLNTNGTETMEYSTTQQHYQENNKKDDPWKQIDNTLEQKEENNGSHYFKGRAGKMSGSLKRLAEGVSIDVENKSINMKPTAAANAQPKQVDDHTVVYRNAWPGVDLEYELRGESVKEVIVVKDNRAQTTFNFEVDGGKVINHPTRKGELTIAGLPNDYSFTQLTLDVNGRGVISEQRVTQAPSTNGDGIVINLDRDWVRSQPDSSFPMRIDPTLTRQSQIQYKMFKSDGYGCDSSNCYANTGSIYDGGWRHWRSYIRYDYSGLSGKTVLSAKLYGWFKSGIGGTTTTKTMYLGHANCSNGYSCVGSAAGSQSGVTSNFNIDFTSKMKSLVAAKNWGAWWSIRGQEGSSLSYKPYYDMKATITYDTPTPMANPSSPANGATVVTTTPTVQVNAVTDADGGTVQYYHRIATNPDAETGAVINSGWTSSRSWQVPANILQDGRTYYWHTYTKGYAQTNPNWVRSFKVDLRTGKNSTQAYEEIGPIAVDLATGNATTSTGSHSISALGGDIGLTLNYNTPALVQSGTAQKTATKYGLTGYYYNDPTGSKTLPVNLTDPSRLLMVRSDNALKFNWGNGAASPGLPSDKFLARWKGYITVPTATSYTLGVNADDGVRIKLGTGVGGSDETTLNSWSNVSGNRWGTAKNLPANQPIPITVEYYEDTGAASLRLLIKGTGLAEQEMPVTWIAPNANVLPDGWELAQGNSDFDFERLHVQSNGVVLSDSTGQKYEYKWDASKKAYQTPLNQEATLFRNDNNTYTVLDIDGKTYIFDAEGKLTSVTAPEDDRQPAELKYEYAGNPSRLVKISDGVNGARNGTLHYSGDSECQVMSGFDAVPAGYLCAFKTTDGKKTTFQYKDGNLSRVVQPGDAYVDYGYDGLGRINTFRDALANDAIAYGVRANDASATAEVSYNASGKVTDVTAPAATTGASREQQTIEYLSGATAFHVTGAPEPHGFSRKITYDSTFRTTSDTDVTNLTSTQEWHATKDFVLSATEPTGLKSTTIYDENDMPVDNYGPAPSAWFGSDRKPLSAHVANVSRTQTGYDEGVNGAAVTWYNYQNNSLAGAPLRHTTGVNTSDPTRFRINTTNPSDPPLPAEPTNGATNMGFRAVGKIHAPTTGNYTLTLWHANAARVFVNDVQVLDGWSYRSNTVTSKTATVALNANQPAQIVVEYANVGGGDTAIRLGLDGNGVSTPEGVWGNLLRPGYGLETSTTVYDAESGNVRTETTYFAPEYGQIDKTIIDPAGLGLENKAEYEAPGNGFLRQTGRTIPGGAKTGYEHYSATETRDNPCTTETESILQAGFMKKMIEPDPDGSGPQSSRTVEYIYDATGNEVAQRYNDEAWTCITHDDRDRPLTRLVPGVTGRTITYNYLVDNNPLKTSIADSEGTIITESDLLGRTIVYTDTNGKITETTYDTYGKVTTRVSPIGTEIFEYNDYDLLTSHKLDSVEFAALSYDSYRRIQSIDYGANVSLDSIARDQLGRETGLSFTVGGSETVSDSITRHVTGEIKNGTENGVSKSYVYDKAGRLVSVEIGDNEYTYSFGAADASCSSLDGNNPNAGKSGNRTELTINGQSTTYCYDQADRLIASSDERLTDVEYDERGNTTRLGNDANKTEFEYDASNRNIRVASGDKETTYTRDALDRIISRALKDNGTTVEQVKYGFTDDEDAASFTLDGNNDVVRSYLSLPGGVTVTINPESTSAGALTYSLPNLHGDVMATVNADGALTGKYISGPFGETLPVKPSSITTGSPQNTGDSTSASYLGKHQKHTDTETTSIPDGIIQMGARVYIPTLGRFLSVDPIDGAGDNAYSYANDPVNMVDLDGEAPFLIPIAIHLGRIAIQQAAKKAAQAAAKKAAQQAAKKAAQKRAAAAAKKRAAQQLRNKVQYNAIRNVKNNPRAGQDITSKLGKIGDPKYKTGAGWRKMQYQYTLNGRRAVVHYFYNIRTKAVQQIKITHYQ